MNEPRQKVMSLIGAEGCYFLSIVRAAEKRIDRRIDAVELYLVAVSRHWMAEDCYVIQPDAIMGYLVGGTWTVRHEVKGYHGTPDEVVILRYELTQTGRTFAHFVLAGPDGAVEYDPYGHSRTVWDGQLASKRVLKQVAP